MATQFKNSLDAYNYYYGSTNNSNALNILSNQVGNKLYDVNYDWMIRQAYNEANDSKRNSGTMTDPTTGKTVNKQDWIKDYWLQQADALKSSGKSSVQIDDENGWWMVSDGQLSGGSASSPGASLAAEFAKAQAQALEWQKQQAAEQKAAQEQALKLANVAEAHEADDYVPSQANMEDARRKQMLRRGLLGTFSRRFGDQDQNHAILGGKAQLGAGAA